MESTLEVNACVLASVDASIYAGSGVGTGVAVAVGVGVGVAVGALHVLHKAEAGCVLAPLCADAAQCQAVGAFTTGGEAFLKKVGFFTEEADIEQRARKLAAKCRVQSANYGRHTTS